ncbi:MAG TPA: hypothetical protein VEH27_15770 [Methylomirabilota bacterium]|nr:hypothetical protein [Methylomirabilota bacterium]
MKRVALVALLVGAVLAGSVGCKSNKGAQEFIPGKGWRPVR